MNGWYQKDTTVDMTTVTTVTALTTVGMNVLP